MSSDGEFDELLAALARPPQADQRTMVASGSLVLDRYRVVDKVGEGGFGAVFAVEDAQDGDHKALKILRRAGGEALLRFKREFRALADVRHPHVVRLFELHSEGERALFTMELLDGVPLNRHLDRHPDDLERAFGQLAEGVSALHELGLLHRDLKPSNVIVEGGGRVVLVDFGLARELDADGSTVLAGTPRYMSPEQCAEQPLTEASDWYAYGVMLYERLTGEAPFTGTALEVMAAKQTAEPKPPSVDSPLASLCTRLLAREASRRPRRDAVLEAFARERPAQEPQRRSPSCIGRDAELEQLRRALSRSREGLVELRLSGPSGMGKSTLLATFVDGLGDETVVLSGRCYRRESVPFKAVDALIDELRRRLASLSEVDAAGLMPRGIHELAELFPVLSDLPALRAVPRRRPADPRELRRRAFVALKELLARMADRQPLVMIVDDLQWSDLDSARLLTEVLGPPEAPAALFIGSYRAEGVGRTPALDVLLQRRQPGMVAMRLAALDDDSSMTLARSLVDEDDRVREIASAALGHPMMVHELARSDAAGPSRELESLIRARAAGLPAPARRLLDVLALAGAPLTPDVAKEAVPLHPAGWSEALEAIQAERLATLTDRVAIAHDRVGESLRDAIDAAQGVAIHARLAAALERHGGEPERIAQHWRSGREPAKAHPHFVAAAERARSQNAFARAAELYAQARATMPANRRGSADLVVAHAEALALAGRGKESADAYLQAAVEDPGSSRQHRLKAARNLLAQGHLARGMDIAQELLVEAGMRVPRSELAAAGALVAEQVRIERRGLEFERREEALCDPDALWPLDVCQECGWAVNMQRPVWALAVGARSVRAALDVGEPNRIARGLSSTHSSLLSFPRRGLAAEMGEAIGAIAGTLDDPMTRAVVVGIARGNEAVFAGRFRDAEQAYRHVDHQLAQGEGHLHPRLYAAQAHRWTLWQLGDLEALERLSAAALRDAEDRGDRFTAMAAAGMLVPCALARDDVDEASRRLSRIGGGVANDWLRIVSESLVGLHAGSAADVHRRMSSARSHAIVTQAALGVPQWGVMAWHLAGVAAAQVWQRHPLSGKAALLYARAIARVRADNAEPTASAVRAGVAWARGHDDEAAALYERAAAGFEVVDMALHAAACQWRAGQLMRSSRGDQLLAEAETAMRARNVVTPWRYAATLTAGPLGR